MAIKSFADVATQDVFTGADTKDARTLPKEIWESAKRKLDLLNAAQNTYELRKVPSLHFESLEPNRPGFLSIRINLRYRVIFQFKDGNAHAVSIENYHGRKTQ